MAQAEDLDLTIDGFDTEILNPRSKRRHNRKSAEESASSAYYPPRPAQEPAAQLRPAPAPAAQRTASRPQAAQQEQQRAPQQPQPQSAAFTDEAAEPTSAKSKARVNRTSRSWREWGIVKFITDERTRIYLGIILLLMSVFVVIALASHFKNGAHDQSIVNNSTLAEMAANPGQVHNATGGFGAWLSQIFLCDTLGLGSIVFIAYTFLLGLSLLGYHKVSFWSLTFKSLLVAISISMVLGLVTYSSETALRWGGAHGHYVNEWIMSHASWIGAVLVSAALILAVVCVYLNELHTAWAKWQQTVKTRRAAELFRKEKEKSATQAFDIASAARDADPDITDSTGIVDNAESEAPEHREEAAHDAPAACAHAGFSISEADIDTAPAESPYAPAPMPEPMESHSEAATIGAALGFVLDDNDTADDEASDAEPDQDEQAHTDQDFTVVASSIEMAEPEVIAKASVDSGLTAEQLVAAEGYYDPRADLSNYKFPDIELLEDRPSGPVIDLEEQQANKNNIVETLMKYNIPVSHIEATVGPTVTLYEIVPGEGVRISQIKRLEDDIALSLAALGIRIVAPIPGRGTVGIEVPNKEPSTVSMRSVIASKKYQECKLNLPMAMGATISNDIFIADLTKMPHLLVAGATGMGKSVGLNAILASLLYKKHPSELKFVLIDPKMVEFSLYSKLERHFLAKLPDEEDAIITDTKKVIQTLNSLCVEMDNRYALLRTANVRTLEEYNKKFKERRLSPAEGHKYLPYIVVVVDEFADLIMTAGKEVEMPIARIAQKARAVGMHMIIATQRPSANVITGLIKANFPGRIAFRVIQMVDSRTILDSPGANQLIGRGDMLFSHNGSMTRVQCAFLSTEEVEAIVNSIDSQVGYASAYYLPEYVPESEGAGGDIAGAGCERDALFEEAARFVVSRNVGSTSSLQRQFNIGYNRAGRLMDQMEAAGIIGPVNGAKPRAILLTLHELEYMLEQNK